MKANMKFTKKLRGQAPRIFLVVSLFILFCSISYNVAEQYSGPRPVLKTPKKVVASLFPTIVPKPTATPVPTATPTPAIPAGFCLQVPVIMYHHVQPMSDAQPKGQGSLTVDPGYFDQQMEYILSHGYTSISAQQLVDAIRSHSQLPGRSIVITLDDGYEDNYQYAFQILKKYNLVGNIMVATGLLGGVGDNTYFTWDQLKEMVNSGHIYAYDHTWSHYPTGSGNPTKDQEEIMTAKQQLESNLGKPISIFTYPYGSGQGNSALHKLLQQDGFVGAFSTIGGSYQCESNIMALRRIHIGNAPLSAYGL